MLHSCLQGTVMTHKIAVCPDRKLAIAKFLAKYEAGTWMPLDEMQKEAGEKEARGQLGDYVTESTDD